MNLFAAIALFAVTAFAQTPSIVKGSMGTYTTVKTNIMKSAEKMPEENFAFKPTPDIRSFGELLGHVADAQYLFCSAVMGEKTPESKSEKTSATKAALVADLTKAFAYCDKAYASVTDESALKAIKFFGRDSTPINTLDFNTAHNFEHYGNIVTYMRLKGIVPPSSEPRR